MPFFILSYALGGYGNVTAMPFWLMAKGDVRNETIVTAFQGI